ncbi:DUF3077 domain-containing protein [Pseudomonas sp. IT-P12]|jgi:hypothetical protein|uniref:DUF6124 family protein n=1 Tax=Pseudomonas sp. IT-P12 TaxID=3026450 RepID=UPI0039E12447
MTKPTLNPPEKEDTSPYESFDSKMLNEAAQRALDHHFPPNHAEVKKRKRTLFTVSDDLNTETLLANASEDMLGISTIAARLADDVDDSSRSVALTISRMADGVYLLIERALDHLDEPEMAAIFAKQEGKHPK